MDTPTQQSGKRECTQSAPNNPEIPLAPAPASPLGPWCASGSLVFPSLLLTCLLPMKVGSPFVPAGKTSLQVLRLSGGLTDNQLSGTKASPHCLLRRAFPGLGRFLVPAGDTVSRFLEALASGPMAGGTS